MKELIMCPKCKGNLDEKMDCLGCGAQYEYEHGVYNVMYEKLLEEYEFSTWNFDENDRANTIRQYSEFQAEYESKLNQETVEAWKKNSQFAKEKLLQMEGTVLDIATGRGMFLEDILSCHSGKIHIIGSDIDARILTVTKQIKNTGDNVSYIGMDARHMALKDSSVENVVSFVGLANMPETEQVVNEIYRVLKKGGTFLYKGVFTEKKYKSYAMVEEFGLEKALNMDRLVKLLKTAGFSEVTGTITAEAVWAENPFDGFPIAGDIARYGVILAKK